MCWRRARAGACATSSAAPARSDRPFEEQHEDICIAAVTQGTFQYRSRQGSAVLAPGALLLGNAGTCFECGHEHGTGDRCLAFHFTPEHLETVVAAVPGARRTAFTLPHLPPLPALMPLIAEAEAARDDGDGAALEELSLRLAGAAAAALAGSNGAVQSAEPARRAARHRGAAPDRGGRARDAACARRSRARGGDQPVSFPAHLPPTGRHDAAPVRAAHAPPPRGGAPAPVGRGRSRRSPSTPASTTCRPSIGAFGA